MAHHSKQLIAKRWTNAIDKRLQNDRITARIINQTKNFETLVKSTWTNIITINTTHDKNWVISPEVLMGINPPRPSMNEATR